MSGYSFDIVIADERQEMLKVVQGVEDSGKDTEEGHNRSYYNNNNNNNNKRNIRYSLKTQTMSFSSSSSSSSSTQSTMTMIATVGAGCVATYYITTILRDQREQRERALAYNDRLERKIAIQQAQQEQGLPAGTLVPEVLVEKIFLWEVEHLGGRFSAAGKQENLMHPTPGTSTTTTTTSTTTISNLLGQSVTKEPMATEYNKLIDSHDCVLADIVRRPQTGETSTRAFIRAGPRKYLHFDPAQVNAAIVTCGGLCPGLNNVIREITKALTQLYGISGRVYGIRGGFKGFHDPALPPLILTMDIVENIHHEGGTFLGSSRGGFEMDKILAFIKAKNISQLYIIGGDGTHRGAFAIHEGCMAKVSY